MEKRQTFDFWSLRRPKELSDCGRSSPAFESLGRQFEPARAERTSSSGLAEAGESQNCLSRKRGHKTIKRACEFLSRWFWKRMEASFLSFPFSFFCSLARSRRLSVPALTWCARALSFFLFSLLSSARNTRISALLPASGRPSPKLSRRKEQADKRSLSLQHLRDRPIDLRAFFSRSPSRPSPPPPLSLCTPSLSTNKHQQHAQRPHRGHGHRCALLRLFLGHEDGDDDDDKARRSPILGRFVSGASPLAPGLLLRSLHALRAPRVRR